MKALPFKIIIEYGGKGKRLFGKPRYSDGRFDSVGLNAAGDHKSTSSCHTFLINGKVLKHTLSSQLHGVIGHSSLPKDVFDSISQSFQDIVMSGAETAGQEAKEISPTVDRNKPEVVDFLGEYGKFLSAEEWQSLGCQQEFLRDANILQSGQASGKKAGDRDSIRSKLDNLGLTKKACIGTLLASLLFGGSAYLPHLMKHQVFVNVLLYIKIIFVTLTMIAFISCWQALSFAAAKQNKASQGITFKRFLLTSVLTLTICSAVMFVDGMGINHIFSNTTLSMVGVITFSVLCIALICCFSFPYIKTRSNISKELVTKIQLGWSPDTVPKNIPMGFLCHDLKLTPKELSDMFPGHIPAFVKALKTQNYSCFDLLYRGFKPAVIRELFDSGVVECAQKNVTAANKYIVSQSWGANLEPVGHLPKGERTKELTQRLVCEEETYPVQLWLALGYTVEQLEQFGHQKSISRLVKKLHNKEGWKIANFIKRGFVYGQTNEDRKKSLEQLTQLIYKDEGDKERRQKDAEIILSVYDHWRTYQGQGAATLAFSLAPKADYSEDSRQMRATNLGVKGFHVYTEGQKEGERGYVLTTPFVLRTIDDACNDQALPYVIIEEEEGIMTNDAMTLKKVNYYLLANEEVSKPMQQLLGELKSSKCPEQAGQTDASLKMASGLEGFLQRITQYVEKREKAKEIGQKVSVSQVDMNVKPEAIPAQILTRVMNGIMVVEGQKGVKPTVSVEDWKIPASSCPVS